jgi:hypothetical protein
MDASRYISVSALCLAFLFACPGFAIAGESTSTFNTKSYSVQITTGCEEGELECQNITYVGTNLQTGKSIRLKGRDVVHHCPDDQGEGPNKTICHHVGFEFSSGRYLYFVADSGYLEISRGKRVLLHEKGKWDWEY